ncbi:MAG TPA: SulP family inorganic anion transporter [Opitutales bacterium]|jgi:SulP family sulfate permease|nr:SulP family inorganic anion transporter [Opitutales bacterium]
MPDTQKQTVRFRPALVDALKDYSGKKFLADLNSGITVGLIAIPLAIGFAIASGVTPLAGLMTAIVAGFLISALGGSRYQIGGPTGAFVPILAGIVATYGTDSLLICTFMAGVMLVLMGMAGLGKVIKYIPYPVTMGFTSGIAVIIFVGEIKDFLELPIEHLDAEFVPRIQQYFEFLGGLNVTALLIGTAVILIMIYWPTKWQRYVPGSMVGMVAASLVVKLLHLKVITIGDKWHLQPGLPAFHLPHFHFSDVSLLMGSAMTIAMLGAIESLLSAVVADGLTNDKHDSNQELLAQGIANICSPLCGGIAATGAIARTGTNIRCGAISPVSGIIHALTLLIILCVAAPLANAIPLCALAGILLVVSFKMGEWHEFARLRRIPRSDALVFITVFLLTVLMNLTWGVAVGVVLAAILFIKRVSEASGVTALDQSHPTTGGRPIWADDSWPEGVYLFRVQGAFFFGSADMLETSFRRAGARLRVMVLLCEDVFSMDATGLNALESLNERLRQHKRHLILCKVAAQPLEVITQGGFLDELGPDNLTHSVDDALQRARVLLNDPAKEK